MADMYQTINGVRQLLTDDEKIIQGGVEVGAKTYREKEVEEYENASATRKLAEIREIRNMKLTETDWQVTSAKEQGTNLSTSFKNWRQGLRDIPTTYTTESEYDELLARDDDGNLTHSIWSE